MDGSWKRTLLVSGLIGTNGALLAYLGSGFVPKEWHGGVLLSVPAVMWIVLSYLAGSELPLRRLAAASLGIAWGFLLTLTVAISLQNWRISVNWEAFLPGLVVIPLAAFLTVLPFRLVRRVRTLPLPRRHGLGSIGLSVIGVVLVGFILAARFGLLPVYKKTAPPGDYDLAATVSISEDAKKGYKIRHTAGSAASDFELDIEVTDATGLVPGLPESVPVSPESLSMSSYTVKNLGRSMIPGGTYDIEFYVDEELVSFDRGTGDLKPRGFTMHLLEGLIGELSVGMHTYRLLLDPDNRLQETNEDNNVIKGRIEVTESNYEDIWGPVDIEQWRNVPHIKGRVATEEDIKQGRAVFHLQPKEGSTVQPIAMDLPKCAILRDEDGVTETPVIVIQAEAASDEHKFIGYRNLEGGNGVCTIGELEFLEEPDVSTAGRRHVVDDDVVHRDPAVVLGLEVTHAETHAGLVRRHCGDVQREMAEESIRVRRVDHRLRFHPGPRGRTKIREGSRVMRNAA